MRIRSRLVLNPQQIEEVGCGAVIDTEDIAMVEGELIPPVAPNLPPVDLKALADQLPDLSNLDNLTVNIQANTFVPPPANSQQISELASATDARLGHL
jgi:hypothetical protein